MKEVKFRAFITHKEHMCYGEIVDVEWIDFKNKTITFKSIQFKDFGLVTQANFGEFDLMQFTGLYDNTKWSDLSDEQKELLLAKGISENEWNGCEIYENDILQGEEYPIRQEDGYVLVVEYDQDRYWGVRTLKANSDVRGISNGIADGLSEFAEEGLKVIGNIYENSSLLQDNWKGDEGN